MTAVTPETLAARLQDGDEPLILDIRSADEFEEWHIPDSVNIEVADEVRNDPDAAKAALSSLPTEKDLVTVCGFGVVSREATDLLRDMGYEAETLEEGLVGWSQVHLSAAVPIDIAGTLVQVTRPGKGCLSYVVISDGQAAVFDPSQYVSEYQAILDAYDAELIGVYETHAHADHLSGAAELAATYEVPHYLHEDDSVSVEAVPVEGGDTITIGQVAIDVLHTPGHSPGGVTYEVDGQALLTGDTVFHESVGRVELGATVGLADADVEQNAERLYESLRQLTDRNDNPLVLPAHDPGSPYPPVIATLAEVRERNPDLHRDRSRFIDQLTADVPELPPNVRQIKRANVGLEGIDDADRTTLELGPNRCAAE